MSHTYAIKVRYSGGGGVKGKAVAIHGATTHSKGFTDGDGEVTLEHSEAPVDLYVGHESHGRIRPGTTTVVLR